MNNDPNRPSGMTAFIIVWLGQIVSIFGTAISNFGLSLWAYEVSGAEATPLAMMGVFFTAPLLILSPVVGVLVDRGNRKLMMMLSDLAAAATTVLILILYTGDNLQIWHLYLSALIMGTFNGFQWPAFSAAIATMLDKKHYARANALLDMAGPASGVFAPLLASALIGPLGITGLLWLDLVSAAAAVIALLFVHVPQPPVTEAGQEAKGSFFQEALYGLRYLRQRPSLLLLQTVFMLGNFFTGLALSVRAPLILARANSDPTILGSVQSAGAIGGLAGGLLMGAWGGFKRRIHGVLLGWILFSLLGTLPMGLGQSVPVWLAASFLGFLFTPLINGSNQAIWQAKVPPDVQGRVFSIRRLVAWLVNPLAGLLAGPLADEVFGPAMEAGGALAPLFGPLVGTGQGAGIGLMFVFAGALSALVGLGGYLVPRVRGVESALPDYDTPPPEAAVS